MHYERSRCIFRIALSFRDSPSYQFLPSFPSISYLSDNMRCLNGISFTRELNLCAFDGCLMVHKYRTSTQTRWRWWNGSFAALVIWEGNTFAEALVKRFTRKQCSLPEKNEIPKTRKTHTCFSSRNSQIRKHRCVLYPPTTGKKRKKWKKNSNTKMKRHGRKGQPWAIRHADGGWKGWRGASFERQSSTCASGHFTRRVYHLCIPCRTDNV